MNRLWNLNLGTFDETIFKCTLSSSNDILFATLKISFASLEKKKILNSYKIKLSSNRHTELPIIYLISCIRKPKKKIF